jgi:hypothetical protein
MRARRSLGSVCRYFFWIFFAHPKEPMGYHFWPSAIISESVGASSRYKEIGGGFLRKSAQLAKTCCSGVSLFPPAASPRATWRRWLSIVRENFNARLAHIDA